MARRLLLTCLCLTGCLEHEARVVTPPAGPDEIGVAYLGFAPQAIPADPPPSARVASPLPVSIPVTWYAYRRQAGGGILRQETTVTTPEPWWQWFPWDILVDFAPVPVTVTTCAAVTPRVIPLRDPAELRAEAKAHGYAR